MPSRQKILEDAIQCVTKDRNATHGEPENNFQVIADYWTTYLRSRGVAFQIKPHDVAVMMVLQKMSRVATSPEHSDHWVDAAGYSACGGEITTKKTAEPILKGCKRCKSCQTDNYVGNVRCYVCDKPL